MMEHILHKSLLPYASPDISVTLNIMAHDLNSSIDPGNRRFSHNTAFPEAYCLVTARARRLQLRA